MAAAEFGIAMGRTGSDLTLDTVEAIMVRDELGALSNVIASSPAHSQA